MDENKFEKIKVKVVENTYTRDDVLDLVQMIETMEEEVEELIHYVLEETELNNELDDLENNL